MYCLISLFLKTFRFWQFLSSIFVCVMRRKSQSLVVWVITIVYSWHKRKLRCFRYLGLSIKDVSINDIYMLLWASLCYGPLLGGRWGLEYKHQAWLNAIPPGSTCISPHFTSIYILSFLLVAVIDKAIWRWLVGCQWLWIKIPEFGLIF